MKTKCQVTIYDHGDSFVHEFQFRPIKGDIVTYNKVNYEVYSVIQNMDEPEKLPFVVLKRIN